MLSNKMKKMSFELSKRDLGGQGRKCVYNLGRIWVLTRNFLGIMVDSEYHLKKTVFTKKRVIKSYDGIKLFECRRVNFKEKKKEIFNLIQKINEIIFFFLLRSFFKRKRCRTLNNLSKIKEKKLNEILIYYSEKFFNN